MSSVSLINELTTLSKDITYLIQNFTHYIKLYNELYYAIGCISFNPIFWNIVARFEYNTHFLTKITGLAKNGCYLLAAIIFSLGIYRDHVYHQELLNQPTFQPFIDSLIIKSLAILTFGFGNILVISSMWSLEIGRAHV